MKQVINGGISTTTVPYYTKDALLLAMQDEKLAGVSLNIYHTKDQKLVAYATPTVDHGKEKISDLTLHNLQRRNFGKRVRNHPILELQDALNIFENSCKMLVLNLNEEDSTEESLKQVLDMTDLYPNIDIYIKTASKNILQYLLKSCHRQRIGVNINPDTKSVWDENLDFFSVCQTACDYQKIKEKVEDNKRILLENVNTPDQFDEIYKEVKDISKSIYVITDSTSCLVSIIIGTYNDK